MSEKPSLRIDWFDGTLIEDARPNTSVNSAFADEDQPEPEEAPKPQFTERKPIGFKRLLDISSLNTPILKLEVSHRPGFWNLLDEKELKGDFIVLILKILANVYKSLEPGENSKIVKLLRSRFQHSTFLVNVKNYLAELPSVKTVDKRLNTHLWDDAEGFFNCILDLCEGITQFEFENIEFLKEILDILDIIDTSVLGVVEEHRERFDDKLFERIVQLKAKIQQHLQNEEVIDFSQPEIKNEDKYYFKNLHIFPNHEDLLFANKVPIEPNIINGAYTSVDNYLDIQFKLLREDCFGPLRDGIGKYLANPSKRRHENIRVHPKVRILRNFVSNNKVGHLVDIAYNDRNKGITEHKRYNKQLMFGSLLLFTCDNFENILCATVLDSGFELLSEGYIAVSFQNPTSKNIYNETYLMVESEVFFEPYHRVLKVLQSSRIDDLPMRRYIVDVQTETRPPSYLNAETIYTIPDKTEEIPFPVLDTNQWPNIGLDNSQFEAFKCALTHEFAVIQGPPGTGKTYIGIKIASTILNNLSLEGTPMLVICYTNHALDQFLEGILNITTSIVRLGSQSKSPLLEKYTLHNLRMKTKSKYSYLYANKRTELEKIFKQMTDVQSEIEKCEKEIVSYKHLKPYLNKELKKSKEDNVVTWLFEHLNEFEDNDDDSEVNDNWEAIADDFDEIETCFSEKYALKEIESMLNSVKYIKEVSNDFDQTDMVEKLEAQISKVRRRLNWFKKYRNLQQSHGETENVKDLYSLEPESRWRVYYNAVGALKSKLLAKMNALLEQHNTTNQELNEVATLVDSEVMKTVRVVGVTTTTAARRHDLMKKLLSPIVIVEEAAEVLEAHIVASLTNKCEHLILIGDHKQLRPTAAHYKLAKDYNLDISLFERMINNNIHSRTLTTQHRMRENFVQLIVPSIYNKLDSHTNVYGYADVKGMKDNLYFFTHDVFEDSEGMEDSWSHKNTFEAKWCVTLADYLRQYYTQNEITILTTYNGQVSLIKELSKKYPSLRDIKITAVDNYQGEENRIIILSLVRSNKENKIGFLNASNRICVALSRAKEGFYIFGNMNVLKSASNIWRDINKELVEQGAIGSTITIRCNKHRDNIINVTNVEDFDKSRSGSCLTSC